jgi:hypothetical protein
LNNRYATSRYYYRDAAQAKHMADKHGFEFIDRDGKPVTQFDGDFYELTARTRYQLDPMLEGGGRVVDTYWTKHMAWVILIDNRRKTGRRPAWQSKIIERGGHKFFTPDRLSSNPFDRVEITPLNLTVGTPAD